MNENEFEDSDNIEKYLWGDNGKYLELEVADDTNASDFMPDDIRYPNASRYMAGTYHEEDDSYSIAIIENRELCEKIIIELKRIHGLRDPWDDDPDYFKKKE